MKIGKYWVVHNPEDKQLSELFCVYEAAEVEAKYLAKKHLGQCFLVLETVGGYAVAAPEPETIEIVRWLDSFKTETFGKTVEMEGPEKK